MSLGEGGEFEITEDEGVGPGSEDTAIVDASAVDPAVVQQQDDEAVDRCYLFDLGMSLGQ